HVAPSDRQSSLRTKSVLGEISIAPSAPQRPAFVQPSLCGGFAPHKLLIRFAPEPYPIAPAAYPASTRSEYIRWVQSALNDVLGLQLPTNGYAGPATRDAIRTFQQQSGIPADGVVGPDTERALLAARAQQSGPGGPPTPPGPAGPPPT